MPIWQSLTVTDFGSTTVTPMTDDSTCFLLAFQGDGNNQETNGKFVFLENGKESDSLETL